jgi:hypothetical protein
VHWPVHAESYHTVVKLFFFLKKGALVYRKPLFYKRTPLPIPETATVRPELPEGPTEQTPDREPWQHPWPPLRRPGLSPSSSSCSAPPSPSAVSAREASHPSVLRRHVVLLAEGWSYGELS